jgi:hypothetical protein
LAAAAFEELSAEPIAPMSKGVNRLCVGKRMADGVSSGGRSALAPILAAGGVGAVAAATTALWVHYGSAVFFEMIAAGFRACF